MFRNLRKISGDSGPKKLSVRLKIGPETPQKSPESSNKVSISHFSEISGISAKISGISETFGIFGIIFGVSTGPLDNLGNFRENAITFYSGLQIR